MGDSDNPVVETPEGEATPQGQTQEQPQETQQKYVTEEQLSHLREDIIRDVTKRDRQRAQEIKQRVAALEGTLKGAGLEITDEDRARIEGQVIAEMSDDSDYSTPPPSGEVPPFVAAAIHLMQQAGVKIEENDPEFNQFMEKHLNNPGPGLLADTQRAIEAKQARTLQRREQASLRTPAGGETASHSSDALMREYQERAKPLRGNVWAISELQREMREKARKAGYVLNI